MTPRTPRARALTALLGLLAGLAVTVAAAPTASAEEVYARDADGVFAIEGHGWGHGHGMSQWGAQGGASLGKTSDQITAFYYPGTAKTTLPNRYIRVWLQADYGGDTQVYPATGLTVTDLATGSRATLPGGVTRWRAAVDSAGLHVQSLQDGTWRAWALNGKTTLAGPVQFGGTTFVRVLFPDNSSRDYRGGIRAVKTSSTTVRTVNALPMESYLLGVVPRESSASWRAAALQSQAIAARSYSDYKRAHAASTSTYDICDTTQCQVYGGAATWSGGTRTSLEPASTTAAVQATAGVVRTYSGASIFAEYSSSNGGWSTDGGLPYLRAQRDDWDGELPNSVHSWTARLTAAQLEARYPAVGSLRRMRVTLRDGNGEWGGRVKEVVLEGVSSTGAATSVTTTGAGVYNANRWPDHSDGLRSSWWHVAAATSSSVVATSTAPVLVRSPGRSTGVLTATMRNTGTTTWSTTGLHLAVASPAGQADPLVGNSTKPGTYTGSATSIPPGSDAAFRFNLTGDGVSPGTYARSYRLRNGSGALYGASVSWTITVEAAHLTAAQFRRPTSLTPKPAEAPTDAPEAVFADGRTVVVPRTGSTSVRTTAQNTGNVTWPAGGASTPTRLGTSGPRQRESASAGATWLSPTRAAAVSGTTATAPDGVATFDLTLHGNGLPAGITTEAFEPVWEGVHWLDGDTTAFTVVRVDPAVSRAAALDTATPPTLALFNAPSGQATMRLRLRNVGGDPWLLSEESVRATATPLAARSWSGPSTPPKLAANVTRPGQTKVYPGEVGEWRIPLDAYREKAGTYNVTVQAVRADGVVYGPRLNTRVTVTGATFTASLVRTNAQVDVPRAGRTNTWFDVRNTSNVAWPVNGLVRSEALTSGGSPSAYSSWISPVRPGPVRSNVTRPGSATVEPGEVARFVITLAGNDRSPGTRSESFGVLWESWRRAALKVTLRYRVV